MFRGIRDIIIAVGDLVQIVTYIVMAIALLVFFWGLAKFILKVGGDPKAASEGRTLMMWGLIALFVMVSVWGIIAFFQNELGLPGGRSNDIPSRNIQLSPFSGPSLNGSSGNLNDYATPTGPFMTPPRGTPTGLDPQF